MIIIDVIIPVYNEENSISKVIEEIPKNLIRNIIVADNNSNDQSAELALRAGAIVVHEKEKGYGAACLKALDYIASQYILPQYVIFLDGDYSDYPQQIEQFVDLSNQNNSIDLIIGSRVLGRREAGSLTFQQRFGNALATWLINLLFGVRFTDLGPFRMVKYKSLLAMNMKDRNFGWTVEMQIKAAKLKMKCHEIPVNYRCRIGVSKVSGTIKGTILAGEKILRIIFLEKFKSIF